MLNLTRIRFALCSCASLYSCASLLSIACMEMRTNHCTWAAEPKVMVEGWKLESVRTEPDLLTPIGCRFDSQGGLFVVECHTHFPPDGYSGPKVDRIYRFDDSDGNGSLDRQVLFHEGGVATMGVATSREGWLYAVTRSRIDRMRDADGDGRADQQETLIRLETTADYPHNGLSSIAFGPDGWIYFGQGENFGQPYRLIGPDGVKQSGGGEGGNLFRCRPDGRDCQRVATGFWNPFGTCFDAAGRLWTVDNDPDSRPPCRLIHVVEGADYGFQFRFGRAGTHPLLAWNGELPGTLPMASGTGEAPCAVIPIGDSLWVSSWGDNRIEAYRPVPHGASWKAEFTTIVQGDVNFRPVDFAVAPDGSVYFTDWVDRSYPVHQKGRLWRLVPDDARDSATSEGSVLAAWSPKEQAARRLTSDPVVSVEERWQASRSNDPFLAQAAITGLVRHQNIDLHQPPADPKYLLSWLQAVRWMELCDPAKLPEEWKRTYFPIGMKSSDSQVHRFVARWAAESGNREWLGLLKESLDSNRLPLHEFAEATAAMAYLESGSASPKGRDPKREALLLEVLRDPQRSTSLRTAALRWLPSESEAPSLSELERLVVEIATPEFRRQAVDFVAWSKHVDAPKLLRQWVLDSNWDFDARLDALSALSRVIDKASGEREGFEAKLASEPRLVEEWKTLTRKESSKESLPSPDDEEAWKRILAEPADAEKGRRVLMRSVCVQCHGMGGRGPSVGPDLATLAGTATRERILESILHPSREVGPIYVAWKVRRLDGSTLEGAKLNSGSGTHMKYLLKDGSVVDVPMAEIEEQVPSRLSIMPADAYQTLTTSEIRDLVAYLSRTAE
jgi:putative membrane-bound dehydrogenase-like protein